MTEQVQSAKPLWRRIADFPLVTMVIAAVIFMAATAIGIAIGKPLEPMGQPERAIVRAVINIGLVLAAYKFLIVRLGAQPHDDLKWTNKSGRELGLGLLAGFAIMALAVGIAAALGVYRIIGPGDTSTLVLELVGTAIIPGFMEELFFRGILFRWVEEFGGSWLALLLTSALFGAAHLGNPNATWFAAFCIAIEAGLLLGAAYMLTRSLWLVMGLHAAWNFTQGEIFDVNVSGIDEHGLVTAQMSGPPLLSGNGFGLEASVIGLTVATAAGLWILWLAIRQRQVVAPMWARPKLAEPTA
ncbi:MAG: type II CAAX endopeptidase family protein [Pseudomonadota bacterium]